MNTIKLIIAWMWICLPLGWGVYKSVQKSVPLFEAWTYGVGQKP